MASPHVDGRWRTGHDRAFASPSMKFDDERRPSGELIARQLATDGMNNYFPSQQFIFHGK
jgi:hypothetical protein